MKATCQSRTLLLGLGLPLLMTILISPLREVNGLARKTTWYSDSMCEVDTGFSMRAFGEWLTYNLTELLLSDFNECVSTSENSSAIAVCDATTGEVGTNFYSDQECTEIKSEGWDTLYGNSSCNSAGEECPDGALCTSMTECTDDEVPARLSPTAVNFVAEQYNDDTCTDPTGNTVIVEGLIDYREGQDGDCTSILESWLQVISQCHEDGSFELQYFSIEDTTCSGDVWFVYTYPADLSLFGCSAVTGDDFYYRYITCTTDEATVVSGTPSPVTYFHTPVPTTPETPALPTPYTRAPVLDLTADSTSPTTDVDDDGVLPTPYTRTPVADLSVDSTSPTTDVDDDGVVGSSLAPVANDDEDGAGNAPSPIADSSGSITAVTAAPNDVSDPGEDEEGGNDGLGLASGAVRTASGVEIGTIALSCAMGVFLCVTM